MILQKASNGFDRVAILEFDGERMLCQRDPGLLLIRPQGRFEKGVKASGLRLVGHIVSREGKESLRSGLVSYEEMIAKELDMWAEEVYEEGPVNYTASSMAPKYQHIRKMIDD